jgi:hypothetical protein
MATGPPAEAPDRPTGQRAALRPRRPGCRPGGPPAARSRTRARGRHASQDRIPVPAPTSSGGAATALLGTGGCRGRCVSLLRYDTRNTQFCAATSRDPGSQLVEHWAARCAVIYTDNAPLADWQSWSWAQCVASQSEYLRIAALEAVVASAADRALASIAVSLAAPRRFRGSALCAVSQAVSPGRPPVQQTERPPRSAMTPHATSVTPPWKHLVHRFTNRFRGNALT